MRSSMLALIWLAASLAPGSAFAQRTEVPRSMAVRPRAPHFLLGAMGVTRELPSVWNPAGGLQHGQTPDPIASPLAVTASLPEDAAWEGFITPAGITPNGLFIEFHGKLVLQNNGIAGGVVSPYLATWDGTKFEALPLLGSEPTALGIWNDHLIASVYPAILMLDGSVWDTLGTANNLVWALREYQGHLIVGGRFTSVNGVAAPLVAAYDGSSWSAAGTGMSGFEVTGLAEHAGSLVAAGNIFPLHHVASLASLGGAWQTVGAGFTSTAVDVVSDGVNLYASGGLGSSSVLARWNGATWNAIGGGGSNITVWNGKIVTPATPPGGPSYARLSQWDGVSVTAIPGDSIGFNHGSAGTVGTWGTKLVVSGGLSNGSMLVPYILVYDGAQWSTVSLPWAPGMTGPEFFSISDMHVWGGKLIVAGGFSLVADRDHWANIIGIAAWDGAHWSPLGGGVGDQLAWLTEYGGDLIAGGYEFVVHDGVGNIHHIARWNGSAWSALGSNPSSNTISSIAPFQTDLYAGSDQESPALQRWNGVTWTEVPGLTSQFVGALAPAAGRLVVGGSFPDVSGIVSPNVAFWDGTNWQAAGAGVNDYVDAATEWLGQPVIGGYFTASGTTPVQGVAIWDGSAWQPMGTRAVEVYSLRVLDGELFATGEFRLPDNSIAETIAHWTGTDWHVLGSGSNGYAFASYSGYLYQSGIGLVHGHPSHNLSRVPLGAVLDVPRPQPAAHGVALSVSPNPARTFARFSFTLPAAGRARLTVIDLSGRVVATLVDGPLDAGAHEARWTTPAPAGVYFAQLDTPGGQRRVVRVVRFE